jgi:hypothetical protein
VTRAFNRLCHFTLKLQGCACKTAWKQFALLIHKLQQEVRILVIDVLDTASFETAVFLLLRLRSRRVQISDVFRCAHSISFFRLTISGSRLFFLVLSFSYKTFTLIGIGHGVFVECYREKAKNTLITFVGDLKRTKDILALS